MVIKMQPRVRQQLRDIFDYHEEVAGKRTAYKITRQIRNTIYRLQTFPCLGIIESDIESSLFVYRSLVAHYNYKVIYRIEGEIIHITAIWDTRQHPLKLKDMFSK